MVTSDMEGLRVAVVVVVEERNWFPAGRPTRDASENEVMWLKATLSRWEMAKMGHFVRFSAQFGVRARSYLTRPAHFWNQNYQNPGRRYQGYRTVVGEGLNRQGRAGPPTELLLHLAFRLAISSSRRQWRFQISCP
jgi:hypothetical protein